MKKQFAFTILSILAIAFCSNVAFANDDGYRKWPTEKVMVSKIEKSDVTTYELMPVAILNPETETYRRQWVSVDYAATPLPNHDLLPTKNIWLINCSIKFC